jgi:hypothetical protein
VVASVVAVAVRSFVAAVFVFVPDTGVGCNVTIVAASGIMFAYLFRRLVSLD